jgi:hypothetical protein
MENQSLRFTQPHPLIPMSAGEVPKRGHYLPMFVAGLSSKKRNSVVCCHTPCQSSVHRLSSFYTSFHLRRYQKPITTPQCLRHARDLIQNEMSGFGTPRLSGFFHLIVVNSWRPLNLRKHENDSAITWCLWSESWRSKTLGDMNMSLVYLSSLRRSSKICLYYELPKTLVLHTMDVAGLRPGKMWWVRSCCQDLRLFGSHIPGLHLWIFDSESE